MQVDLHCGWLEEILVGRDEASMRHFEEVSSWGGSFKLHIPASKALQTKHAGLWLAQQTS